MAEKCDGTDLVKGAVGGTAEESHGSKLQCYSTGSTFGVTTPQKKSWPELEGVTAEEAEKKIKEEMPMADVKIIPEGDPVTMDFWTNRVRIFVDSSNKVVGAPMVA